jgi:hypothetical protein
MNIPKGDLGYDTEDSFIDDSEQVKVKERKKEGKKDMTFYSPIDFFVFRMKKNRVMMRQNIW